MRKNSIYIHWPFCKSKCPYCDFNSHVRGEEPDYKKWQNAYLRELDYYSDYLKDKKIETIFFGGGTPSLMPAGLVANILDYIKANFNVADNVEITLEANPTSIEIDNFKGFRIAGINRVSIGVQAFNELDLKFLGREHSKDQAIQAIELADKIFDRYSFDLIYSRPTQNLESWRKELEFALTLSGSHISLYQLTIEKGTKFFGAYQQKAFSLPDENTQADMYELTLEMLEKAGMPAYEISNFAKAGHECRHNLVYWNYQDYLGIGAGAHSRITMAGEKLALMNIHSPENWLESINNNGHAQQSNSVIKPEEAFEEAVIMGLRIREGINLNNLKSLVGKDYLSRFNQKSLEKLQENNFIKLTNSYLFVPQKEWTRLNEIIRQLIA